MELRMARSGDVPAINALIARSIQALHTKHYDAAVIAASIEHAYGVDWHLIHDGSYFAVEMDGVLAAAGGWSRRETIAGAQGSDAPPGRVLDAETEAARIRAFYVDPSYVRRGIGAALLAASENGARNAGFRLARLTSTLQAIEFYSSFGYEQLRPFYMPLPGGVSLSLMLMEKRLAGDG